MNADIFDEMAHALCEQWWDTQKISYNWTNADERALAAAIRAAVAEEREACARAAETQAGGHYMAKIAAFAIRARTEGGS